MNALERLRVQTRDLTETFIDDDGDAHRPLMTQLRVLGPHMHSPRGIAGKTQPSSRPPGNLTAYHLHRRIIDEATSWAWTLSGSHIKPSQAMKLLPTLAQQRIDSGNPEKQKLLYGRTGLYATVAEWHRSIRIFMGYDKPADRYPTADCPECHYRDRRGGSIRANEELAWCGNPDCRDENGHRHEWWLPVLQAMLADSIRAAR